MLLKRTEFFFKQHRMLFDNPDLYSVLCLIDDDSDKLAHEDMWDKKRKFLTFFEEIALLVKSGYISESVAFYMFAYYVKCAKEGENFWVGIKTEEKYWHLFNDFAEKAKKYLLDTSDTYLDVVL